MHNEYKFNHFFRNQRYCYVNWFFINLYLHVYKILEVHVQTPLPHVRPSSQICFTGSVSGMFDGVGHESP